jgi:hypothetical protein
LLERSPPEVRSVGHLDELLLMRHPRVRSA